MSSYGVVSLLDADPGLAELLDPSDWSEILARIPLPVFDVGAGPFEVNDLVQDGDVRGDALGIIVLAGHLRLDARIAERAATRLILPPEWLLFDGADSGSMPVRMVLTAERHSRVAILDRRLEAAVHKWPRLLQVVLARAAQHAHQALLQQAISQLPRVEDRLVAFMWAVADRIGQMRPEGVWFDLPISHDMLGTMTGARRPTVSLGLRRLAEEGVLRSEGTGWLLDPSSSERLVSGPAPADDAGATPKPVLSLVPPPVQGERPAILVISRDPLIAKDSTGHDIVTASEQSAALSALDVMTPDVLVLDTTTPGDYGTLLTRLRTDSQLTHTRLLLFKPLAAGAPPTTLVAAAHDYLDDDGTEPGQLLRRIDAQAAIASASGAASSAGSGA